MYKKGDSIHFFLPFALLLLAEPTGAGLEATLEAREDGATDVALLPATDLMLSRALFYKDVSKVQIEESRGARSYLDAILGLLLSRCDSKNTVLIILVVFKLSLILAVCGTI